MTYSKTNLTCLTTSIIYWIIHDSGILIVGIHWYSHDNRLDITEKSSLVGSESNPQPLTFRSDAIPTELAKLTHGSIENKFIYGVHDIHIDYRLNIY